MITFETKVWEKDWEYILKGDYLEKMISNCNAQFSHKQLIVNNVCNRKKIEKQCAILKQKGIIDTYYFVEDYSKEVLNFFNIDINSFNGGYVYSIAELVGIYLCKTKFLLHFSGDSYLEKNDKDWITIAMQEMNENDTFFVANPVWNKRFNEAKREAITEIYDFYIGEGFSDQCYLIRTKDFQKQIYNEIHPELGKYPKYGGELFEKRVDAYMIKHNKRRITFKKLSYISKNLPRNWFSRKILKKYILKQRLN